MKPLTRIGSILITIIVLAIFTLPTVFAQMGMPGGPQHPGPKETPSPHPYGGFSQESFKERLGLTDEQVEKFAKIRSEYLKEAIKKEADIQVAGLELTELLEQKKVDLGQVEKKVRQVESLKSDLTMHRIKMLFKTKDFLNDEQFEKLKKEAIRMMQHGMMRSRMESRMMEQGMMGQGRMGQGRMNQGGMGQGMMKEGQGMMGRPGMDSSEEEEE